MRFICFLLGHKFQDVILYPGQKEERKICELCERCNYFKK